MVKDLQQVMRQLQDEIHELQRTFARD
jgi:hypothetical protein